MFSCDSNFMKMRFALLLVVCSFLIYLGNSLGYFKSYSSSKILVTVGPGCDFDAKKLLGYVDDLVIKREDEVDAWIRSNDRNQVILLENPIENLASFASKYFYDSICLNGSLKECVEKLNVKINSSPKSDKDLQRINPEERGKFYSLMMQVDGILNSNQIPYWGISGTLLGAVRHKGMIPWDDDIDIILTYQSRFQLEQLLSLFRKRGLELVNYSNCMYKIFPLNGKPILNENCQELGWKYPFVDIFLVNMLDNQFRIVSILDFTKDIYSGKNGKKGWSLLPEELSFPIQRVPFGPMQLPIPNDPLVILKREYGNDCMEVAYMEYSHENEKVLNPIKVPILDFSPPEYTLLRTL